MIYWFIEYILIASSVAGRLKRGDSATEKTTINYKTVQVVVLTSLAQLLVFVELARCARSIQIEIKDVICM